MGGLKKQQSIKINFDTLPDKKKSDENHSFSLSSNNIFNPQNNSKYPGVTSTKLERLLLLQCYALIYILSAS